MIPRQPPAQKSLVQRPPLDPRQQQLARATLLDEIEGTLWVDARKIEPKVGAVAIPSWDNMMLGKEPIGDYPIHWRLFEWPNQAALSRWKKWIPNWVQQSCALFPSHQITLLHAVAKYPQLLDLLDHAPVLAWKLITTGLPETDLAALLQQKQTQLASHLGWPEKRETLALLRKLRLRYVNQEISESIETCLIDSNRLHRLQRLPRINSMALSLAARFPQLIGSTLHQTLAQLPCRPMQCQAMVAQLEDTFKLAEHLNIEDAPSIIGKQRYLTDVEKCYQKWLNEALPKNLSALSLTKTPQQLTSLPEWQALSQMQQHPWWIDWVKKEEGYQLWAWRAVDHKNGNQADRNTVIGVLLKTEGNRTNIVRIRTEQNQQPNAEQLTAVELWLKQQSVKEK